MKYTACILMLLFLTPFGFGEPEPGPSERWFFDLQTPGGSLPIELIGSMTQGSSEHLVIRNDVECIPLNVDFTSGGGGATFSADLPGFRARLAWTAFEDRSGVLVPKEGAWFVSRRSGATRVPFSVSKRGNRFELPDTPPTIDSGRYRVVFSSAPDDPAVGLFTINDDGTATGTFLTTTGDYRYLAGNAAGDTLRLSTFDGAHAFLFHAEKQPDGSLKGDFWSGTWWHETWTATPDPDFRLPDPFAITTYQGDAASLERLAFTSLEGVPTPVGALAPHGSPRVVLVFGSWCPNCHDATRLLTELHEEYREQGLKIVGLAFEHSDDEQQAIEAVRTYAGDLGVEYPVLIAGLSDKKKASESLPVLDRVRAYPTTLFIDPDGDIRAVHSGFSGPATGEAHEKLRADWRAHIEAMLAELKNGADMPSAD